MIKKIALKPCRHCAFTKHHLGTKEEIFEVMARLAQTGAVLGCHEYTESTACASHAKKLGLKGELQTSRGDLKQKYAHITKAEKDKCGLGGFKLSGIYESGRNKTTPTRSC